MLLLRRRRSSEASPTARPPIATRWWRSRSRSRSIDVHATIYTALGIPADTSYVTEGRPFYVTKDGKGKAIDALIA